ncbi:hypothetical protein HNQ59_003724, partial [Chitinivorax tropicus]|nr:hypothetical protein [Chitinivorax tropicus]
AFHSGGVGITFGKQRAMDNSQIQSSQLQASTGQLTVV